MGLNEDIKEIEKIGYTVILCSKCRKFLVHGGCIRRKEVDDFLKKYSVDYIGGKTVVTNCPDCGSKLW